MKKVIIILILFVGPAAGYLYYDWHKKTNISDEERYTYLYSWTDKQGQTHFSDKNPPPDAKNIKTVQTLKQLEKPVILQMKESVSGLLHQSRGGFAARTDPQQEEAPSRNSSLNQKPQKQVTTINKIERRKLKNKKKGKT